MASMRGGTTTVAVLDILRRRRSVGGFQLRGEEFQNGRAYHPSMTHEHEHHEHYADHVHDLEPIDYVDAVEGFRTEKDYWFKHADGSPIPPVERDAFTGLAYFPIDPALRFDDLVLAPYAGSEPQRFQIPTSDGQLRPAHRAGSFSFELEDEPRSLAAYVLDDPHEHEHEHEHEDGSGDDDGPPSVFVPFLDATRGRETYGAGR